MLSWPSLEPSKQTRIVTDEFGGYNHYLKISAEQWYDTKNLTTSYYPLMAVRPKRGVVSTISAHGIIAKESLAYIDGTGLYYGGHDMTTYLTSKGVTLTNTDKQLVSMGAYLCIFPDKVYFNTENYEDCGYMESTFSVTDSNVTFDVCDVEGTIYDLSGANVQPAEPSDTDNVWIDTSGSDHVIKRYSETSGMWVQIPDVYVRIGFSGIGNFFSQYDGVKISGITYTGGGDMASQFDKLNDTHIIYGKGDNFIVIVGMLDLTTTYTQSTGTITISRSVPDMDFVCEAQNRLWGCKYGLVDGKTVNEIYGCKLGDCKNWNVFMGVSTDSWAASVGSDGQFTGAINHLGHPTFFKENCIHRVTISAYGAHQISDTVARGIQKGSSESAVIVNDILYYKSRSDVCAYDGSLPETVSGPLGKVQYYNAAAGCLGEKYYVSMKDSSDVYHLFAYDTSRGMWMHEDNTRARFFAKLDDDLYFYNVTTGKLMTIAGTEGTLESEVEWEAVSGILHYEYPDQKYVTRYDIRTKLDPSSTIEVYIQYDSSGRWEYQGTIRKPGTGSFVIPVRPRRCDHLQIKLSGTGDFKLFSIARLLTQGSDVV